MKKFSFWSSKITALTVYVVPTNFQQILEVQLKGVIAIATQLNYSIHAISFWRTQTYLTQGTRKLYEYTE